MSLPWSEEELAAKLGPLHCNDVTKLFATVIFKRPELLKHVPELTEQLRNASDISDPAQQLEVLDWIETALIPSPTSPRARSKVDDKPPTPLLSKLLDDSAANGAGPRLLSSASNAKQPGVPIVAVENGDPSLGASSMQEATASTTAPEEDCSTDASDCIVQFSTPVYYAKEGEDDLMTLDVIRLGPEHHEVYCKWHTQDGDGKAGSRYVKGQGELLFKPGEILKHISVDIIESPEWSASLEFKVILDSARGCSLGRYLFMCRVKVIDPDCFPSNKFKTQILANDWPSIPKFKLLLEYFRFNYRSNPIVHRRSKHQLIIDQIVNAYFILKLYIGKVVIDKVLQTWNADPAAKGGSCKPGTGVYFETFGACPDPPDDVAAKEHYLLISAIIIVLPMFLIHYLEFWKVYFKIGGTSRKTLQGNLVRKFLNYDETARAQIGPSDLIMAMTRDTENLVHDGYMQIFPLAKNLGRLGMMVGLQLYMKADIAVILVFVYPVMLFAFLVYRNKLIYTMSLAEDQAQNEMVNYTTQIMTGYNLIGDFLKRPDTVEEIEKKVGLFNKNMVAADAVNLNNKYFVKYLALFCAAFWNVAGGIFVLEGSSEVGKFVTNLQVFNQVGAAWTAIFEVMLKMQSSLPYLEKIVTYMNLPIDLEKRMRVNRTRRMFGEEARLLARTSLSEARKKGKVTHGAFAADFVPITLNEVAFSYTSPQTVYEKIMMKTVKDPSKRPYMRGDDDVVPFEDGRVTNCSISFDQGLLVAVIGVPEEGKSTVMKLLGAEIIPDSGDLLIPPHLRALHVSPQPIFFNDTLLNNLTYGVGKDNNEDGSIERVVGICRLLGVSEHAVHYLDKENKSKSDVRADWGDVLNATERVLLNLARAFIANPEIVVVHKPTALLDDLTAAGTLNCMREFVSQKGLLMDPKTVDLRRPRTCIMTTARVEGMHAAHRIFRIKRNGVEEVSHEEETQVQDHDLQ